MNQLQIACNQNYCIYCTEGICGCEKHIQRMMDKFHAHLKNNIMDDDHELTEDDFFVESICKEQELNLLDPSPFNSWKIFSENNLKCSSDFGSRIVQLFDKVHGYVYYAFVPNEDVPNDDVALNRALIKADEHQCDCPKWTEIPESVLREMLYDPFEMVFFDEGDLPEVDLIKMKDLVKKYPYLRDVFVFNDEDWTLAVYAGAMCKIRWELHNSYGSEDYIRSKKKELCKSFCDEMEKLYNHYFVSKAKNKEDLKKEVKQYHGIAYSNAITKLMMEEHITSEKASQVIFNFLIRKDKPNMLNDIQTYAHQVFLNERYTD